MSDREKTDRYRLVFDSIDQGFCIIEMLFEDDRPVDYRFLEVNAAFERQTDLVDAVGRTMRALAPAHEQHWFDRYGRVAMTGNAERFDLPAASLADRWYNVFAFRIDEPDQRHVAILFSDMTEMQRGSEALAHSKAKLEAMVENRTASLLEALKSKQHQEMLSHEIGHRLKNILAIVLAIVTQTLRSPASLEEIKKALLLRIHALSKAHELLFENATGTAKLLSIVHGAIRLYDDASESNFVISGPDIEINAKSALMLALMIHELSTNATKYGALSNAAGIVTLDCSISDGEMPTLNFVWQESGGPPVRQPDRKGFGSRLIEQALAETVSGKAKLEYLPGGVVCRLVAPLAGFTDPDAPMV